MSKENVTQSLPQVSINRDDFFFKNNTLTKPNQLNENLNCSVNKDSSMLSNIENEDLGKKILKFVKNTNVNAKKPMIGNFIRNNSQKALQNDSSVASNSNFTDENNLPEKIKLLENDVKNKDNEIKSLKHEKEEVNLENEKLKQVISELAQKVESLAYETQKKTKTSEDQSCQTSLYYIDIDENFKKIHKLESEISKQNLLINQLNLENKILNQENDSINNKSIPNIPQSRYKKLEFSAETTNNPSSTGNIENSVERDSMFYDIEYQGECNTNKLHENVNNFLKQHDAFQSQSNENTTLAKAQSLENTASL